jgi:hypothetical protein
MLRTRWLSCVICICQISRVSPFVSSSSGARKFWAYDSPCALPGGSFSPGFFASMTRSELERSCGGPEKANEIGLRLEPAATLPKYYRILRFIS